eukprot:1264576-Alexandrium_andersonii.AAC.1
MDYLMALLESGPPEGQGGRCAPTGSAPEGAPDFVRLRPEPLPVRRGRSGGGVLAAESRRRGGKAP